MTIKLTTKYLVPLLVMCFTTSAYAAMFCVNDTATLSIALNIAESNSQSEEIRLQAGLYVGNFVYNANVAENGDLVVRGGFNAACTASSGNPNDTVLDGNGVARAFVLSGRDNSDLTVSTITIRGGLGQTQGADVDIDRTVSVNVTGNVFAEKIGGNGDGLTISDMRNANIRNS